MDGDDYTLSYMMLVWYGYTKTTFCKKRFLKLNTKAILKLQIYDTIINVDLIMNNNTQYTWTKH